MVGSLENCVGDERYSRGILGNFPPVAVSGDTSCEARMCFANRSCS